MRETFIREKMPPCAPAVTPNPAAILRELSSWGAYPAERATSSGSEEVLLRAQEGGFTSRQRKEV